MGQRQKYGVSKDVKGCDYNMRHAVGDVVTIRPDLFYNRRYYMDDENYSNTINSEMVHLGGQRVKITNIVFNQYVVCRSQYLWTDEMFSGGR